MDIKYLTVFTQHPYYKESDGTLDSLQSISTDEISALESSYNNGNPFPTVLAELLYLAGGYCYVLDYTNTDSQDDMQQVAREYLSENNLTISRPFYVVEMRAGASLFVYLDEGKDDPDLYEADAFDMTNQWLRPVNTTLLKLINARITRLLSGYNPY